jgi:hypothetical protein
MKVRRIYLDLGAWRPTCINNTQALEEEGWFGISFDINDFANEYARTRLNPFVQADLITHDWNAFISKYGLTEIDYLSFDVDDSTIPACTNFPFDKLICKTITIEHDAYRIGPSVRDELRDKLRSFGYQLVCADVLIDGYGCFEDWWVHSSMGLNPACKALQSNGANSKDLGTKMMDIIMQNRSY